MTQTLSDFQAKLLTELANEFNRLNPKPTVSGSEPKRFTAKTITECISEEQQFRDSIAKFNTSMLSVLKKDFDKQVKEFAKEFKSIGSITFMYFKDNTADNIFKLTEESRLSSSEVRIQLVSKTKRNPISETYIKNNGMAYVTIYCSLKTVGESIVLQSGKNIGMDKIVGFTFSDYDWLGRNKEHAHRTPTFDGLVQSCKTIQQKIVALYQ